jgi:hypothetical protein
MPEVVHAQRPPRSGANACKIVKQDLGSQMVKSNQAPGIVAPAWTGKIPRRSVSLILILIRLHYP